MHASVVVALRLSCSAACGILLNQGIEPVFPALAGRFLTTGSPGKFDYKLFDSKVCFLQKFPSIHCLLQQPSNIIFAVYL